MEVRLRFNIELKPGETTIVSWKKLVKDAKKPGPSVPDAEPIPALGHAPGSTSDDTPMANRFNAVVEKIERLYVNKQSSDEEDGGVIPDDDQYDTEDSFIDDTELDEYFEVDKSITRHNGYYVNKGKLEHISEANVPALREVRKQRKDSTKRVIANHSAPLPNKHAKLGHARMKVAAGTPPLSERSSSLSWTLGDDCGHRSDGKWNYLLDTAMGSSSKKPSVSGMKCDYSSESKFPIRDAIEFQIKTDDMEKQSTIITRFENSKITEDFSGSSDLKLQRKGGKKLATRLRPGVGSSVNNTSEPDSSTKYLHKKKTGNNGLPDLNYPAHPIETYRVHVKDTSTDRKKGTMLERAIRDLEKVVAESRPQNMEVSDADNSVPIKRRLPREVKQKLAKVARLAARQGKISDELIDRLMRILGHMVQRRTLKRHLREMVSLGLSAKQEKDVRVQQIKSEVIEMIKLQTSKQQNLETDYFQETPFEVKRKEKNSMDHALEDKICDLYDLYIQGMDEDKGPQIRKLYVELAELWPNGAMDNHGIKKAIHQAKERQKMHNSSESVQDNARRKLLPAPKVEDIVYSEATCSGRQLQVQETQISNSSGLVQSVSSKLDLNVVVPKEVKSERVTPGANSHESAIDRMGEVSSCREGL